MSTLMHEPVPVLEEIRLLQRQRELLLYFKGGTRLTLPCAYLRQRSPAVDGDVNCASTVNVVRIDPVGRYAVRLCFDDGHETGIYSFEYLYQLGMEKL